MIVIGTGPAGSTAAKTLAEKGLKALLVEKFKLPRYKSCSGELIKKTLDLVQKNTTEMNFQNLLCASLTKTRA